MSTPSVTEPSQYLTRKESPHAKPQPSRRRQRRHSARDCCGAQRTRSYPPPNRTVSRHPPASPAGRTAAPPQPWPTRGGRRDRAGRRGDPARQGLPHARRRAAGARAARVRRRRRARRGGGDGSGAATCRTPSRARPSLAAAPRPRRRRPRRRRESRCAAARAGGLRTGRRGSCCASPPPTDRGLRGAGPPLGLWVRGQAPVADVFDRAVSVVGARAATGYGEHVAAELGYGLGSAGMTVVSGAAYGIDGAAHRGALNAGGPTVAVLGCGIDIAYPAGHSHPARQHRRQRARPQRVPAGHHPGPAPVPRPEPADRGAVDGDGRRRGRGAQRRPQHRDDRGGAGQGRAGGAGSDHVGDVRRLSRPGAQRARPCSPARSRRSSRRSGRSASTSDAGAAHEATQHRRAR